MFARKIIRCIGAITAEDIDNERQVVSYFHVHGHDNIVSILAHGWMPSDLYFIDMELCDLTLNDYINYLSGESKLMVFDDRLFVSTSPVLIKSKSSSEVRLLNLWTTGLHIAQGLEFMHAHGHVHRDLKPGNGIMLLFSLVNNFSSLFSSGKFMETNRFRTFYPSNIQKGQDDRVSEGNSQLSCPGTSARTRYSYKQTRYMGTRVCFVRAGVI